MQCMEEGLTSVIFLQAVNRLYTTVLFSGSKVHEDQVHPGQMLKVPVVLYGQRNGSVPGIVRGELVNKSGGAHFAPLQETQQAEYSCTNLTYTIFSTGYYELILLRVDDVQYYEEKTLSAR